jgi:hypothetical protein
MEGYRGEARLGRKAMDEVWILNKDDPDASYL